MRLENQALLTASKNLDIGPLGEELEADMKSLTVGTTPGVTPRVSRPPTSNPDIQSVRTEAMTTKSKAFSSKSDQFRGTAKLSSKSKTRTDGQSPELGEKRHVTNK